LELRRVVGETRIGENTDRIALLQALARRYHAVVVGKDARTVTAEESGRLCLNLTGNSGMATAGSGDVLSGIIGALLAQSMEPYEASSAGVYLHGYAGDLAAAEKNPFSMVAGDICEALVRALQ
jgi:NAD(P)H-hydrate epimerase